MLARDEGQMALLALVGPARRVPGSWRTLPGWESFRYDPARSAPMHDPEIEGWV